jgi:alpha-beta hydrolase superfamily lysophospholipase
MHPDPTTGALAVGHMTLAYRIFPVERPKALVLFTHGLGVNSATYHRLGSQLAAQGYVALFPDLRGEGQSGGDPGDVDYVGQHRDDLHAMVTHARALYPALPLFLGAHSIGCSILLQLDASVLASARGVFLIAPVLIGHVDYLRRNNADLRFAERMRYWRAPKPDALPLPSQHGMAASISFKPVHHFIAWLFPGTFGGTTTTICKLSRQVGMALKSDAVQEYSYRHGASVRCHRVARRINALRLPVLLITGANDEYIQPSAVEALFHWNMHPGVPFDAEQMKRADHSSILLPAGIYISRWLNREWCRTAPDPAAQEAA